MDQIAWRKLTGKYGEDIGWYLSKNVGNKCDKEEERCIKLQEVVDFAHENKLFYLETSALNGSNVEKAFMTVIKGTSSAQHRNL